MKITNTLSTFRSIALSLAAACIMAATGRAQVLTNLSFFIGSGAGGGGGGAASSCMIMSDGTTWSGGAVGVQGTGSVNNLGGHALAGNVAFKFNVGTAVSAMNAAYGAGNWCPTNARFTYQFTLYANNSRFNAGAGIFDVLWMGNDAWAQGTTNPVFATNAAALAVWATNAALLATSLYTWTTPGYVGMTSDLGTAVWTTDKTGLRQGTNTVAIGLATNLVEDIVGASTGANPNVSLYLMSTSDTLGLTIFTGGGLVLPRLSFDVVGAPPRFTAEPEAVVVTEGAPATFVAEAAGLGPLSFQWWVDGTPLAGSTSAAHTISSAGFSDIGVYTVVASNPVGVVTSRAAGLAVRYATHLDLVSSANPIGYKGALTFSATITPAAATGLVSFALNGVVFDTQTVAGGHAVSGAVVSLPVGTNAVAAIFPGDALHAACTGFVAQVVTDRIVTATAAAPTDEGSLTVRFAGVPGDAYVLEASPGLQPPAWTAIATNTADVDGFWFHHEPAAAALTNRFYRVLRSEP